MVIRSLHTTQMSLQNYGLGPRGCIPLAVALAVIRRALHSELPPLNVTLISAKHDGPRLESFRKQHWQQRNVIHLSSDDRKHVHRRICEMIAIASMILNTELLSLRIFLSIISAQMASVKWRRRYLSVLN